MPTPDFNTFLSDERVQSLPAEERAKAADAYWDSVGEDLRASRPPAQQAPPSLLETYMGKRIEVAGPPEPDDVDKYVSAQKTLTGALRNLEAQDDPISARLAAPRVKALRTRLYAQEAAQRGELPREQFDALNETSAAEVAELDKANAPLREALNSGTLTKALDLADRTSKKAGGLGASGTFLGGSAQDAAAFKETFGEDYVAPPSAPTPRVQAMPLSGMSAITGPEVERRVAEGDANKNFLDSVVKKTAEKTGLPEADIQNVIEHRNEKFDGDISRDALGTVHVKNSVFFKGADAVKKTLADSDLPQSVKDRELSTFDERFGQFQKGVVDNAKQSHPGLVTRLGITSETSDDEAFAKLQGVAASAGGFGTSALQTGVGHLIGGFSGLGQNIGRAQLALIEGDAKLRKAVLPEHLANETSNNFSEKDKEEILNNIKKYTGGQLAEDAKSAVDVSDQFQAEKNKIFGVSGSLAGSALGSLAEMYLVGGATGGLVPALKVAEGASAGARTAAAALNAAARTAPVAATSALRTGMETYQDAKQAGFSDDNARGLGWTAAGIEGGVTMAFGALGHGGLEDLATLPAAARKEALRETLRNGLKSATWQGLKQTAKTIGEEEFEELTITALDSALVQKRLNPNMTNADFEKALSDTAKATIIAAGAPALIAGSRAAAATQESNNDFRALAQNTVDTSDEEVQAQADSIYANQSTRLPGVEVPSQESVPAPEDGGRVVAPRSAEELAGAREALAVAEAEVGQYPPNTPERFEAEARVEELRGMVAQPLEESVAAPTDVAAPPVEGVPADSAAPPVDPATEPAPVAEPAPAPRFTAEQLQEVQPDLDTEQATLGAELLNAFAPQAVDVELQPLAPATATATAELAQDEGVAPERQEIVRKGSFQLFSDTAKGVIKLGKAADITTIAHELGHLSRQTLFNRNTPIELREGVTDEDIDTLESWAGTQDGTWSREAEEKFARGWEGYLASGKAPLASLQPLFDKLAAWFTKIYNGIKNSSIDVELTPEVQAVFDKFVSARAGRVSAPAVEAAPAAKPSTQTTAQPAAKPAEAPSTPPIHDEMTKVQTKQSFLDQMRETFGFTKADRFTVSDEQALAQAQATLEKAERVRKATEAGEDTNERAPTVGQDLVQKFQEDPLRPMSVVENALVALEIARLSNEAVKLRRLAVKAYQDGDTNRFIDLSSELNQTLADFDSTTATVRQARSAAGLALRAGQTAFAKIYSPEALFAQELGKYRVVRDGKKLTESQRAKLFDKAVTASEKMSEQSKRQDAAQKKIQKSVAEQEEGAVQAAMEKQARVGRQQARTFRSESAVRKTVSEIESARERLLRRFNREPSSELFQEEGVDSALLEDLATVGLDYLNEDGTLVDKETFVKRLVTEFGDDVKSIAAQAHRATQLKLNAQKRSAGVKLTPQELIAEVDPTKPLSQRMAYNVARGFAEQGLTGPAVLKATTELFQQVWPKITREQVGEAFTGYGKTAHQSRSELDRAVRQLRALESLDQQIRDLEAKKLKETPENREIIDGEIKEKRKRVAALTKELRLQRDADKIAAQAAAKEASRAERAAQRKVERLNTLRSKLQARIDNILAGGTDATRTTTRNAELADLQTRLSEVRRVAQLDSQIARLQAGDRTVEAPRAKRATSPEIMKLRNERNNLVRGLELDEEIAELRAGRTRTPSKSATQEIDASIKAKTEARDRLRRVAKITEEIADLRAGKIKDPAKKAPADAEIKALREERRQLQKIANIQEKIADYKSGVGKAVKYTRKETNPEIVRLQREFGDLVKAKKISEDKAAGKVPRNVQDYRNKTKKIQEKIAKGDYTTDVRVPKEPTAELVEARNQFHATMAQFRNEAAKLREATDIPTRVGHFLWNTLQTRKLLKLGSDIGVINRQAGAATGQGLFDLASSVINLVRGDKVGAKRKAHILRAFSNGFKSYADSSGVTETRVQHEIENRPNAAFDKAMGIVYQDQHDPSKGGQEDQFDPEWVKRFSKVPFIGKLAQIPLAADRFQRSYLNTIRASLSDVMLNSFDDPGGLTEKELKSIGNAVMTATGRWGATKEGGFGKKFEKAIPALNETLFISARYSMSRAAYLTGGPLLNATAAEKRRTFVPIAREIYLKSVVGRSALYAMKYMAALAAFSGDDDDDKKPRIVLDPRDKNFGRIVIGNTTIDMSSGHLPFWKLIYTAGSAMTNDGAAQVYDNGRLKELEGGKLGDFFTNFQLNRANINASFLARTFITQKYFGGEKVTLAKAIEEFAVPVIINDVIKLGKEHGAKGLYFADSVLFGDSVNSYTPKSTSFGGSVDRDKLEKNVKKGAGTYKF